MSRAVRTAFALLRAAWLSALSYRTSFLFSAGALVFTIVPLFYIARGLQGTMAGKIATEGSDYFGYILIGTVVLSLAGTALNAAPGAVSGGLNSGYLEMLLSLPVSRTALLVGLSAYQVLYTAVRGVLALVVGAALGAHFDIGGAMAAVGIAALVALTYWMIGVIFAAGVLVFRTTGPLPAGVIALTAVFGGVYYPTSVVPDWLKGLGAIVPAAYGLRAMRRVIIPHVGDPSVAGDVAALALMLAVLTAIAAVSFVAALRISRARGTLSQY